MTDLSESALFHAGIYQIATTDPVLGGAPNRTTGAGPLNIAAKELADRTRWLKDKVDNDLDIDGTTATRGLLRLATSTEARAGTDTAKALTPAGAAGAFLRREVGTDSALASGDDLDTITTPGIYRWLASSPANAPSGLTQNAQMIVETDGSEPTQMVWGGTTARIAVRRRDGGVWGAWNRLWSDADATFDPSGTGMDHRFPSGLILQELRGSVGAGGLMILTNRVTFPTAVLGGIADEGNPSGWTASELSTWSFDVAASNTTQSAARCRNIGPGGVTVPALGSTAGRILVWGY